MCHGLDVFHRSLSDGQFPFSVGAQEVLAIAVLAQQHLAGKLIPRSVLIQCDDLFNVARNGVENAAVGAGLDRQVHKGVVDQISSST